MAEQKHKAAKIAIIVLAAGGSARLGRPKQLLTFKGETFLKHTIKAAVESHASEVVVVLGSAADEIRKELSGFDLHIVENLLWAEGMASSIRCGLETLVATTPDVEGMVLMMCDQPFITSSILNDLINAHRTTSQSIVACSYENTFGPPTLFHKSLFDELFTLKGDVGARGILRQHTDEVELIPFPKGTYDVDTEDDYQKLINPKS